MASWLGVAAPLPTIPAEALDHFSALLGTAEMVLPAAVTPVTPGMVPSAIEVICKCAGCRTNYGRLTFYLLPGCSAEHELFCIRSKCHRRTVLRASYSAVTA